MCGIFKGKITKTKRTRSSRSQNLLKVIHTDICGPFSTTILIGQNYVISFIDEFGYLISDKARLINMFKDYKTEVKGKKKKTLIRK